MVDHDTTTRSGWPMLVVLCVAILLLAVPADASRDLPNTIGPALDLPVVGPSDLDRTARGRRELPFFSVANLGTFSGGRPHDYDDPSSRFCIYDGPGRLTPSTEGEGFIHPHLFQGLWTDPVTGIAYARNRWYDARTASWLSEDPLGAVDSPNLYAFVSWAPHLHTDPMGEEWPKWVRGFHTWLSGHASAASKRANAYVKAETDYIRGDLEQVEFWTANLVVRPFAGAVGGYRTAGEAAVGLAVLGFDVGVSSFSLGLAERFGSDRRLDLTADFLAHPIQGTKEHIGGMFTEIGDREARGDVFGASLVSGQVGGEVALTIEGGAGLYRLGRAAAGKARSFRLFNSSQSPTEPYNRRLHYGNTPTRADRKTFGAQSGQVVDHDPPLVMRFFEGDPAIGEKPGYLMTAEERLLSARDRSRMRLQLRLESNQQGAEMSRYSRSKKKEFDLGLD